jgi:hypothetical protein
MSPFLLLHGGDADSVPFDTPRGRFVTLFSAPEGLPPPMCWRPYHRSSLLAADGEEGSNWNRERYDELTSLEAELWRVSLERSGELLNEVG